MFHGMTLDEVDEITAHSWEAQFEIRAQRDSERAQFGDAWPGADVDVRDGYACCVRWTLMAALLRAAAPAPFLALEPGPIAPPDPNDIPF